MPTIQATLCSLGLAAVKGSRLAGKPFAELAQKAENEERAERLEQLQIALEYKAQWEVEFRRKRERGLPEPDMFPHPDDIVFDWATGEVDVLGPLSHEENQAHRRVINLRDRCAELISDTLHVLDYLPEDRARIENEIREYEALYDFANGRLLGRYRKALPSRVSAERDSATAWAEILAQRAKRQTAQSTSRSDVDPGPHLIYHKVRCRT